jgi:DNA-binding transcriptional MerR regulator
MTYTIKQVAEQFGLTPSRIRQLCDQVGVGPRVGSMRMLSSADVRALKRLKRRKYEKR